MGSGHLSNAQQFSLCLWLCFRHLVSVLAPQPDDRSLQRWSEVSYSIHLSVSASIPVIGLGLQKMLVLSVWRKARDIPNCPSPSIPWKLSWCYYNTLLQAAQLKTSEMYSLTMVKLLQDISLGWMKNVQGHIPSEGSGWESFLPSLKVAVSISQRGAVGGVSLIVSLIVDWLNKDVRN